MTELPAFTDYSYLSARVDVLETRLAAVADLLWPHVQRCRAGDACPVCRAFELASDTAPLPSSIAS